MHPVGQPPLIGLSVEVGGKKKFDHCKGVVVRIAEELFGGDEANAKVFGIEGIRCQCFGPGGLARWLRRTTQNLLKGYLNLIAKKFRTFHKGFGQPPQLSLVKRPDGFNHLWHYGYHHVGGFGGFDDRQRVQVRGGSHSGFEIFQMRSWSASRSFIFV